MPFAPRFKLFAFFSALMCAAAAPALAQQVFDNWNTGACNVTDAAALSLDRPINAQRIDIWFHWNPGETSVRYSVSQNGAALAEGDLSRAECDPYQAAWCVARVEPGADLDPGAYVFRTARPGICQNAGSNGQGFIRVFGTPR